MSPTTDQVTLNRRLALARKVRSLMGEGLPDSHKRVTQAQLGQIIGVGQRGVSDRLNGIVPFNFDELASLMDAFDADYDRLFPEPSDLHKDANSWFEATPEPVAA